MITENLIKAVAPRCVAPAEWADALNAAIARVPLPDATIDEFLAQCAFESREFNVLQENLYYKADTLMRTWPAKFPTVALAAKYAMSAHSLGDYVYASRFGNGDEASGDGYRYRGRGLLMVTFRANYQRIKDESGLSVIECPDILCTKGGAALSAAIFWRDNHLQFKDAATLDQFATISRIVNGGTNGESQRIIYWQRARDALGLVEV